MVNEVKSAVSESRHMPPWRHTSDDFIEHFPVGKTPREAQAIAFRKINDAFSNGKRIVVVEMPTGGGKSFVAKAAADVVAEEGGAYMITAQKALQDQYERDFPAPQMELLKGRSNYACTHDEAEPQMHAGQAVCHANNKSILAACITDKCRRQYDDTVMTVLEAATNLMLPPEAHLCPYWKQLQKCNDAKLSLFNFSSFLFQRRMGRFQKRALLLLDEGHNVEAQVMNFVTVELTQRTMDLIGVIIDREITSKAQFVEWLRETEVMSMIDTALKHLEVDTTLDPKTRQMEKDELMSLKSKLEMFQAYLDKAEWILETLEYPTRRGPQRKIVARPLYAKDFANDLLFQHAERTIVFSATILNVDLWAKNLGLSRDEVVHFETVCEFPSENRPVHLEFCGNMGSKHFQRTPRNNPANPTKPRFIAKINQLLERHKGQRGLIHSHSFEISNVLRDELRSPRFLFQADFGGDKQLMMSALESREDAVIVAPAMHEGFDFRDALARFQIIAKVPWPSLGDKVVKERRDRDEVYYGWLTCLKLVQSYGRIVRSKDDWGYTYIVDSGFQWFFKKHGQMIPMWFRDAMSRIAPQTVRT